MAPKPATGAPRGAPGRGRLRHGAGTHRAGPWTSRGLCPAPRYQEPGVARLRPDPVVLQHGAQPAMVQRDVPRPAGDLPDEAAQSVLAPLLAPQHLARLLGGGPLGHGVLDLAVELAPDAVPPEVDLADQPPAVGVAHLQVGAGHVEHEHLGTRQALADGHRAWVGEVHDECPADPARRARWDIGQLGGELGPRAELEPQGMLGSPQTLLHRRHPSHVSNGSGGRGHQEPLSVYERNMLRDMAYDAAGGADANL